MAYRAQPVSNRLCAAQWRARDDVLHRQRLDPSEDNPHAVRAHIDLAAPASARIVLNRRKQELARDQAGERIDRDNAKLLRKMTAILSAHSFDIPPPPPAPVMVAGPAGELHRSLNAPARRKELRRIGADNAAILRRLTHSRPTYDTQRWQAHAQAHDAYLHNMRERVLPADAAAAATLIPLPRFLKDDGAANGGGGGALSERRPAHAYMQGNYSKTFTRARGAAAGTGTGGAAADYSGSQSARLPSTSTHGASGGSSHYHTIYNPPDNRTPNRTGVSKAGPAARVHQLQPIPPAGSGGGKASPRSVGASTSSRSIGGGGGGSAVGSSRAPPSAQILQTGKSFGLQYVLLAVDEMPASSSSASSRSLSNDAASPPQDLSASQPVVPGVHSLLFRCYDPATSLSQVLQVPWSVLAGLQEVEEADPSLLGSTAAPGSSAAAAPVPADPASRKALVECLLDADRVYMWDEVACAANAGRGVLRFRVARETPLRAAAAAQPKPSEEEKQETATAATATADSSSSVDAASASSSASAPAAPTPATHPIAYTDSMGVHYYHDEATGNYLPFPTPAQ